MALSFFTRAPARAVELDELERLGLRRLDVLCAFSASLHVGGGGAGRELPRRDVAELNAFQELFSGDDGSVDTISHYALRLAFCKTRDRIEWLVKMETKLFALRLRSLTPADTIAILAREGVTYDITAPHRGESEVCYKVPFHEATSLVKYRRVALTKGVCLVPAHQMRIVAQHHFRVSLEQQMKTLQRALPANPVSRSFDDRLEPILSRFVAQSRLQMSGDSYLSRQREQLQITAASIDAMAEAHFPLCMRSLHRKLRENHHLKYDGRVQYRLFLKGVGWSVHDTLLFFRNEFTCVIAPAKFDKEYAYHIRHSYGLEGARKDYAPMDCEQIIHHGSAPRHGQYHGCPFRHWDAAHLSAELRGQRAAVSASDALQISSQAASGDFQGACQRFFDASHRCSYTEAAGAAAERRLRYSTSHHEQQQQQHSAAAARVSHPNAWLEASLQLHDRSLA